MNDTAECQANQATQFVHQSQALSSEAAFAYPNKHSLKDDSQAKSLKIEAALLKSGFISLRLQSRMSFVSFVHEIWIRQHRVYTCMTSRRN